MGARRATAAGLAAAALFGASTPTAKLLVPNVGALMLAGLLYLGAGIGITAFAPFRRADEAPLRRADLRALVPMIVAGGILGPFLLVVGLGRVSGVAASLLLNLEAPFTMALAVLAFGDHLSRREAMGAAAVVAGGAAIGSHPARSGPMRWASLPSPRPAPRGRSTTTSPSASRCETRWPSRARRRSRRGP